MMMVPAYISWEELITRIATKEFITPEQLIGKYRLRRVTAAR
jgi:hypothetical protein